MNNRPIGVLDSGVGGLTVFNALVSALPFESVVYVGDSARAPYGDKDIDTLIAYGTQHINFLCENGVKAIVVACGTLCSNVLSHLQSVSSVPVFDIVRPGIISFAEEFNGKSAGVIATAATIRSGVFQQLLGQYTNFDVVYTPCPQFVSIAEDKISNLDEIHSIIEEYLCEHKKKEIDALLMGCTHYPLIRHYFESFLGSTVEYVDMGAVAVCGIKRHLADSRLLNFSTERPTYKFFTSGGTEDFDKIATKIVGFATHSNKMTWG